MTLDFSFWIGTPPRVIVKLPQNKGHDCAMDRDLTGHVPDSSLTSQLRPKGGEDTVSHHSDWQALNSGASQSHSFQEEAGAKYWVTALGCLVRRSTAV